MPKNQIDQGVFTPSNIRDLLNNLPAGSVSGTIIPLYPGSKPVRVVMNPPEPDSSQQSFNFYSVEAGKTSFEGNNIKFSSVASQNVTGLNLMSTYVNFF